MNKLLLCFAFLCSTLYSAVWADPFLEYQKQLSRMGTHSGKTDAQFRAAVLQTARTNGDGISEQDYKFLKGVSAVTASGADWAHTKNISGDGVTVLLFENSGITHRDVRGYVDPDSTTTPIPDFSSYTDHGSAMAAYIHALAPCATIRAKPIGDFSALGDARIINASFNKKKRKGFKHTFADLPYRKEFVLIVKAAGNSMENLSSDDYTQDCDALIPSTIFAGHLRQDYKGRTTSGFPGAIPIFQDNFLWVIAEGVLTASGPENSSEYAPKSGTSGAAAILSGAAALILSRYPTLNTTELKEILLESADRDIFQLFGSGYDAVHIEDPATVKECTGAGGSSSSESTKLPTIPYDLAFWGKGILNIKNALMYASLKQKNPLLSPTNLRKLMALILNDERQAKAKKIQKVFRARTKPTETELVARPSLAIDADLPAREFTKAPGVVSLETIPEQTDPERLAAHGIIFPPALTRKQLKVISRRAETKSTVDAESVSIDSASSVPTEDNALIARMTTIINSPYGLNAYAIKNFLAAETTTLPQKEEIKAFFKTPIGLPYGAENAIAVFMDAFYSVINQTENYSEDMQRALDIITSNIQEKAPAFVAFLQDYAKGNLLFMDLLFEQLQRNPFGDAPSHETAMAQQLVDACRVIL